MGPAQQAEPAQFAEPAPAPEPPVAQYRDRFPKPGLTHKPEQPEPVPPLQRPGEASTPEPWTIEVYDDTGGWLIYDDPAAPEPPLPSPAGPIARSRL